MSYPGKHHKNGLRFVIAVATSSILFIASVLEPLPRAAAPDVSQIIAAMAVLCTSDRASDADGHDLSKSAHHHDNSCCLPGTRQTVDLPLAILPSTGVEFDATSAESVSIAYAKTAASASTFRSTTIQARAPPGDLLNS
jgi:hypothetical protein